MIWTVFKEFVSFSLFFFFFFDHHLFLYGEIDNEMLALANFTACRENERWLLQALPSISRFRTGS
jgi:hypothetical protein